MNYLIDKNSVIGGVDYSTAAAPRRCIPTSANKFRFTKALVGPHSTRELFYCKKDKEADMSDFSSRFIQETFDEAGQITHWSYCLPREL